MKEYKAKYNEDIFIVANKLYGDISYAFKIAKDNDLGINDSLSGQILVYDESILNVVTSPLIVRQTPSQNVTQIYIPGQNQTIFDIALMTEGGFEGIVALVKNSTLQSLNSSISISDRFSYVDSKNEVKKYISLTGVKFANKTNDTSEREHDDSFSRVQFT